MDPSRARLIGKELQVALSSADRSLYFHGTSMHPFLREGVLVIVRPVAWDEVRRGDIVTYRKDDKFPTRRVFDKRGDRLSLRCDGWKHLKFRVRRDEVLGRAEARFRDGQWITQSSLEWRRAKWRAMAQAWRQTARRLWHSKRTRQWFARP